VQKIKHYHMTDEESAKYGFRWGNATVTSCCESKWGRWLQIQSQSHIIDIRITPSGLIRVGEPQKLNL
jgi:hypothetical protein